MIILFDDDQDWFTWSSSIVMIVMQTFWLPDQFWVSTSN